MRVGLRGQTRRVWAPRGTKVRQPIQLVYEWRYLALAVDPLRGLLHWAWTPRMQQAVLVPAVAAWPLDAIIWDRAPSHRGRLAQTLRPARLFLPPYAPELNPAERVFQELRRAIEGRVYESLAAKQATVDQELRALAADPVRVRQLCGWAWIREAVTNLPTGEERRQL